MMKVKTSLLAMAMTLPMICNAYASTSINAFADEAESTTTTTAVSEDENIVATTVTTTIDVPTTTISTVEDTIETTITTTDIDSYESITTTTVAEEDTTEVTTTTWDRISNFPGEDGYLRFWMDDLEDRKGTLTLKYTAEGDDKPISGAQISVYKIANLTVKNGDAKYILVDELKEAYPELNFAGMSKEDLDKLAEELANRSELTVFKELTTDDNGVCKFEELDHGLYVVKQKAKMGMAKDYEEFKTFIINVPFPQTEDTLYNGHWLYDVESLPKTELKGKKKLLITPPKTGDEVDTDAMKKSAVLFGVSTLSAATAIVLIAKRKKKNKSNED